MVEKTDNESEVGVFLHCTLHFYFAEQNRTEQNSYNTLYMEISLSKSKTSRSDLQLTSTANKSISAVSPSTAPDRRHCVSHLSFRNLLPAPRCYHLRAPLMQDTVQELGIRWRKEQTEHQHIGEGSRATSCDRQRHQNPPQFC